MFTSEHIRAGGVVFVGFERWMPNCKCIQAPTNLQKNDCKWWNITKFTLTMYREMLKRIAMKRFSCLNASKIVNNQSFIDNNK